MIYPIAYCTTCLLLCSVFCWALILFHTRPLLLFHSETTTTGCLFRIIQNQMFVSDSLEEDWMTMSYDNLLSLVEYMNFCLPIGDPRLSGCLGSGCDVWPCCLFSCLDYLLHYRCSCSLVIGDSALIHDISRASLCSSITVLPPVLDTLVSHCPLCQQQLCSSHSQTLTCTYTVVTI